MNSEPTTYVNARHSLQGMVQPFSRAVTQQCRMCLAPFAYYTNKVYLSGWFWLFQNFSERLIGRGDKWLSAVLLALEIGWLTRRASALHLTTYRHAEPIKLALLEY